MDTLTEKQVLNSLETKQKYNRKFFEELNLMILKHQINISPPVKHVTRKETFFRSEQFLESCPICEKILNSEYKYVIKDDGYYQYFVHGYQCSCGYLYAKESKDKYNVPDDL